MNSWNEWIVFPYKFSELARDTMIVFKIHDAYYPGKERVVGSTSISIFGKYGALRRDIYDLRIYHDVDEFEEKITSGKINKSEICYKLNKLKNKYHDGYLPKNDWLDKLTFREIERITQDEKTRSKQMYLTIEFPKIVIDNVEYNVVFFEKNAEESCKLDILKEYGVLIYDDELMFDNLVEIKHHQLSRSARSGVSDRDLKPNSQIRDLLNTIVAYPPTKVMTAEEQDLIWKFRFYLMNQKKALTKFLKCVKWDSQSEAKQAIDLLFKWELMDIEDALELLSPQFTHPTVRKYAVSRLKNAPNEDLILYLLQLVQALKYENYDKFKNEVDKQKKFPSIDLLDKDIKSLKDINRKSVDLNESRQSIGSSSSSTTTTAAAAVETIVNDDDDLAGFLINRACQDETFANYFFWYLMVECGNRWKPDGGSLTAKNTETDDRFSEFYLFVMNRFSMKLSSNENLLKIKHMLLRQKRFVRNIIQLMRKIAGEKGGQQKKTEKLHVLLNDPEAFKMNFLSFDPLPLPLDPEIKVKGIISEKTTLFKSALNPIKLTFTTSNPGEEYVAIVKHGDDLRQDQLILQTITLMDKLLRKENLDLKLTPYRVLATNTKSGFVQYIDSLPVAEILKNYDIQKYLKICAPCENATYGISADVMDNYIKSCAGYCIVTYILGVGDRHFDNLMLTKNGNLFHIDFGYILGRDPKPFPPPMKLSKEMVEAMGGIQSEHYQQFRKLCYTAFLHLRRHSNLILNLFNLMIDANIPDIALEPDKTVKKVQDKFRLDLNDEEAVHYIQSLIDISVTAVMATLVEQIHRIKKEYF